MDSQFLVSACIQNFVHFAQIRMTTPVKDNNTVVFIRFTYNIFESLRSFASSFHATISHVVLFTIDVPYLIVLFLA